MKSPRPLTTFCGEAAWAFQMFPNCKNSLNIVPCCQQPFSSHHLKLAHRIHAQKGRMFLDGYDTVFPGMIWTPLSSGLELCQWSDRHQGKKYPVGDLWGFYLCNHGLLPLPTCGGFWAVLECRFAWSYLVHRFPIRPSRRNSWNNIAWCMSEKLYLGIWTRKIRFWRCSF